VTFALCLFVTIFVNYSLFDLCPMAKLLDFILYRLPFYFLLPFLYFFDTAFDDTAKSIHSSVPSYPSETVAGLISNAYSNLDTYNILDESIERFVRKWDLAGASIAIAKEGNLVYAKGFGYANKETGEAMQPYHMLRVASVSKLITAVAIMKLVEKGQIELNSKVFGKHGILNEPLYLQYIDSRVEDITVKQLLTHSAGWTTRWGDHLFMHESIARQTGKSLPITSEDIICFALSKRLHFTPGTYSSYNNLGYVILEKVIEHKTGRPYEAFVKDEIFKPLDIYDAFIAQNFDSLRYPLEVRYYEVPESELVPAYDGDQHLFHKSRGGNDITSLGAAGGWVISSVSLLKFILDIDAENEHGIILSKKSRLQMEQVDPGIQPLGWRWISHNGDKGRTGSFAGTSALVLDSKDGFTFVFLTNCSPWNGAKFPFEVSKLMRMATQRVTSWPNLNLFNPESIYPRVNLSVMADFYTLPRHTGLSKSLKEILTENYYSSTREVFYF